MITRRDRVVVVPKEGASFQFALAGRVFTLFGSAFLKRAHLRGRRGRAQGRLPFLLR
jgi:RNase P/RNase MRP subunit p29